MTIKEYLTENPQVYVINIVYENNYADFICGRRDYLMNIYRYHEHKEIKRVKNGNPVVLYVD